MSAATMGFVDNQPKSTTKKKSPINRARMEKALDSGEPTRIPHGLSTEELRQFILSAR